MIFILLRKSVQMEVKICCTVEIHIKRGNDNILWHVKSVTRQRPVNSNRGAVFLCGPWRYVISVASEESVGELVR
jgi:hypothetical protein